MNSINSGFIQQNISQIPTKETAAAVNEEKTTQAPAQNADTFEKTAIKKKSTLLAPTSFKSKETGKLECLRLRNGFVKQDNAENKTTFGEKLRNFFSIPDVMGTAIGTGVGIGGAVATGMLAACAPGAAALAGIMMVTGGAFVGWMTGAFINSDM